MKRLVLPVIVLIVVVVGGILLWNQRGQAVNTKEIETKVGFKLYVPTSLPRGLMPGPLGPQEGAHRVMFDYVKDDVSMIVSQEKRTPERDEYHKSLFFENGTKVDVNGKEAVLCKDKLGGRQVVCNMDDSIVIVRSSQLTDDELVEIARSLK